MFFFFFSSRRRHTRCLSDWSSDVCSSDLAIDPGSLGVYGFRNRRDWSYDGLAVVNSRSFASNTIWDHLSGHDKRVVIVGVPPSYPPRKVNGASVGCFLTPDTQRPYTHPASLSDEIATVVGDYPVDVQGFRTHDKSWLEAQIEAMTRKHFALLRHLVQSREWDYFHAVEIGLDRMQHGFWQFHDPEHVAFEGAGNPYEDVIRDYYRLLDEEVGELLECLTEDTIVLVVSDHGAQRLDGGLCVNERLIQQRLPALH